MRFSRYWLVSGICVAMACGGVLWAAVTAPPPAKPEPKPAAPVAADQPVPLLPKDRTGVWRSVVITKNGNQIDRHALRFTGPNEITWTSRTRLLGNDVRGGARYRYEVAPTGKLKLTILASIMEDGQEWDPIPGRNGTALDYTILPLDKQCRSFQLVKMDARGRKTLDAVFRHEPDVVPKPDPLVPEYLTKIDRTIKKEPKYINKPKYVLLALGPKAEFKVWVAIDGDVAYIDRNGNGDLTEQGELCKPSSTERNVVRHASGELTYNLPGTKKTIAGIGWYHSEQGRTGGFVGVFTDDHIKQNNGTGGTEFNYASSPRQAAVVHFGSNIVTIRQSLRTSVERNWRRTAPDANGEAQVLFEVGTPGVGAGNRESGDGSFAAFVHSNNPFEGKPYILPVNDDPIAEFEFTPLDPVVGMKKVRVELSGRLGATEYAGKIKVPDRMKTGLDAAKVTLSFPNCPWGKVEPVTFAVDVIPKK